MPTYEYQCRTCSHHFDRVQRFSEAPITECPQCGGEVRRVIHPSGVIFKGSGWYITDSRKGGNGEAKSGDTGSGGEAKSTSSGSSDAAKTTTSTESKSAGKAPAAPKD